MFIENMNETSRQSSMTTKMATISVDQAKNIAFAERPRGVELLREVLGWPTFDEADDPACGILLDFHYDTLMFCVQKGFPWPQISVFVNMAAEIAENSKGKSLPEGVKVYHKQCQSCSNKVSEQNMKQFTEYFFETFFHHYLLYQYVFTKDQDSLLVKIQTEVESPPEPLPFTDGKQIRIWEYEKKLQEIEAAEEEKKQQREETKKNREKEKDELVHEALEELHNVDHPVDKESLATMMNDIASRHITAAGHAIKTNIAQTMDGLEIMLLKTSLPRPQELGPPPRYKMKTPMSGGKRPKSTSKDKQRGSAKAKAK